MDKFNKKIVYSNKSYAVIDIKYKSKTYPLVLDWKDYKKINKLNKKWKCSTNKSVFCNHEYNGNSKDIFIHELIKTFEENELNKKKEKQSIVHLNRINLDNRRSNLIYDTKDKVHNKNLKKKKRTINLPEESGIKPDDIPTFVWYLKPNDSHGERFMVSVGNIKWKTSSSKDLSLTYKLEEAKKYLRNLKEEEPEIFENYSMNGEYTKKGKELMKSFIGIIKKAGYNFEELELDNITDNYLKPKKLNRTEKKMLQKKFN